jgi:hypothetical protein
MNHQADKNEEAHGDNNVFAPPETFQRINIHLENNAGYRNDPNENGMTGNFYQKVWPSNSYLKKE